jgi:hypothetical protein
MTRHIERALLTIVLAALGVVGCSSDLGSRSCAAGRSIACACGGGLEGHQICRADGSGFGLCLGCDDGGARIDGGADGGHDGSAPIVDAWSPSIDAAPPPPDAWIAPDTGPPPPTCAWVWIDRGGPAFQPHACRPGPGVAGGMLVDPEAFFTALVAGRDPDSWQTVMAEIENELWSCGVGQQRGTGGDVRGRLFLPTAACPDASPPAGDTTAMHLGVRQLPECWSHPADVVDCH